MESRRTSFILSWMFLFFNLFVSSGGDPESISLEKRLFVALAGTQLHIPYQLSKPHNETGDFTIWFKNKMLQSHPVSADDVILLNSVHLKNLKSSDSGEYRCSFGSAHAYWFVLVRDEGYRERNQKSHRTTEPTTIIVFISLLLVFSVVGSVYVFRGRWNESNSKGGNGGGKREQSTEEQNNGKLEEDNMEEDNMDAVASSSFYASLEPRPRSIYDVLDHSAANREAGQRKAKPKSKESPKAVEQTPQQQDGVLEFVYENF